MGVRMGFWTWAVCITSLSSKGNAGFRDNHRVRLKIWGERKELLHLHSNKCGFTAEYTETVGEEFGLKLMEPKYHTARFRCLSTRKWGGVLTGPYPY